MKLYNISPKIKKILKAPLILLFAAALLYSFDSVRWTPPIPGGIAQLYPITVNGNRQWLLIRGKNKNAPVLLFLHGGPGASHMAAIRPYQKELENNFIVVQWDQRGAGLSDFPEDTNTLALGQYIADGIKVTEYLKEKFSTDKIYLAGHSWGAALGWLMARSYPQHYAAFASLGQPAGENQGRVQYDYTLGRARALHNTNAAAELEAAGPPPWTNASVGMAPSGPVLKWIKKFKGDAYTSRISMDSLFLLEMLLSTEYRIGDIFARSGKLQKAPNLMANLNLIGGGTDFQMPFYMILGERDLITPMDVSAELYEAVRAPNKKLIIYRDCAHYIMWERPDDYQAALTRLFGVY